MSDVLNLSPFGSPLPNPKKKYIFGGQEEPQEVERIKVTPKVVGDTMYLSSEVDSEDFDPTKIPGMVPQTVEEPKEEKKEDTAKQNLVAVIALRNQAQLKLLHWQTFSDNEHRRLGELYDAMEDMTDNLVEVIMGKYGRPQLDEATSSFKIENYRSPETPDVLPFLNHLFSVYQTQVKGVFDPQKDSEIINLIDGILDSIDKAKYLATLRK